MNFINTELKSKLTLSLNADNLIVEQGIISIDGNSNEFVNFVSSVEQPICENKLSGKQVLISEEGYKILNSKFSKTNFLPCLYNHPIAFGPLTVELIPSNASVGSSFLKLRNNGTSILYASQWRMTGKLIHTSAENMRADELFLVLHEDPTTPSIQYSKREYERLLEFVVKLYRAGERVIIASNPWEQSMQIARNLFEKQIPVSCDDKLFEIQKLMLKEKILIPKFKQKDMQNSVILATKNAPKSGLPAGIWLWAGKDLLEFKVPTFFRNTILSDTFAFHNKPDIKEIEELLNLVRPQKLYINGNTSENIIQQLNKFGIPIECFSNLPKHNSLF